MPILKDLQPHLTLNHKDQQLLVRAYNTNAEGGPYISRASVWGIDIQFAIRCLERLVFSVLTKPEAEHASGLVRRINNAEALKD